MLPKVSSLQYIITLPTMFKNNNVTFYCHSCRTKRKSDPRKRLTVAQVKATEHKNPPNWLTVAHDKAYRRTYLKTIAPHIKKWLFNNPDIVSDVRVINGVRTTTYLNVVITTVETV